VLLPRLVWELPKDESQEDDFVMTGHVFSWSDEISSSNTLLTLLSISLLWWEEAIHLQDFICNATKLCWMLP
jgi:hypothetical protein